MRDIQNLVHVEIAYNVAELVNLYKLCILLRRELKSEVMEYYNIHTVFMYLCRLWYPDVPDLCVIYYLEVVSSLHRQNRR